MQYLTVTIPEKAVTIGSRIGLADTFLHDCSAFSENLPWTTARAS